MKKNAACSAAAGRVFIAVFLATVWLPRTAVASAADVTAVKAQASQLLEAGHARQACAILEPKLAAHSEDLVLRFLIGQCLAGERRPRAAIIEYRYILARKPQALRVRAEMASAEFAAGDTAAARTDLQRVLAHPLPSAVRVRLQALLRTIPRRPQWSGGISLGLMYDSNADLGPLNNVVTLFGAPVQLVGKPPRKVGAWAVLPTVNLNYSYPVNSRWTWTANAAANDVTYAGASQYDFDSYSIFAGHAFHTDRMSILSNFGANLARLGNVRYSTSWGASPAIYVQVSRSVRFDQQFNIQKNRYYSTSLTDGWSSYSVTGLQWHFSGTAAYIEPSVVLADQSARNALYGDDQVGGLLSWFQPLGARFSLWIVPAVNELHYHAFNPAFGSTRHDKTYTLTANLGYQPGFHHSQISLGTTLTENRSNQSLYSYDRTQTTLQWQMSF